LSREGEVYGWGTKVGYKVSSGKKGEDQGTKLRYDVTPTLLPIPRTKEAVSVFAGPGFAGVVRRDGTIFSWRRRLGRGYELHGVWALPKGREQEQWDKVMRWVFLGRAERGSNFFGVPVEYVYYMVIVLQKCGRIL
jgi:hypothetical protein